MIEFVIILVFLCLVVLILSRQAKSSSLLIKDNAFYILQKQYLLVYYLATFSDWLQGPYIYKLYSDYGYDDDTIAILYMVGFLSSSLCGMVVGYLADKYGRKLICESFGILYTICCVTKLSPKFYILLVGRVFGGISTSILFSTFEAWYVNEHLNHFEFPPDWLNETFSKAAFYTGLLAIVAGILTQFTAETLGLGSVIPFLLSIPILLLCSYMVRTTWDEHAYTSKQDHRILIFLSLKLILYQKPILLFLCFIQSLYESVMYVFIFSWTPILTKLNPPLGLVFSIFMLAFMVGSNIYTILTSKQYLPQNILILSCIIALISHIVISIIITSSLYINNNRISMYACFFCFILYEMTIGLYFPAIGYLRGRVISENIRATVTNWFRVPMNIITCFFLIIKHTNIKTMTKLSSIETISMNYKYFVIFTGCSILLAIATIVSIAFKKLFLSCIPITTEVKSKVILM